MEFNGNQPASQPASQQASQPRQQASQWCILYSIQCTVQYTVYCTVYTIQYSVQYTVYCTVYTIQCSTLYHCIHCSMVSVGFHWRAPRKPAARPEASRAPLCQCHEYNESGSRLYGAHPFRATAPIFWINLHPSTRFTTLYARSTRLTLFLDSR